MKEPPFLFKVHPIPVRGFHFSIPVAYRLSSYFSLQGELAY